MKAVRIKLTQEQTSQLSRIEKGIGKLKHKRYAVFAQIRFPDGEMAVVLTTEKDADTIHDILVKVARK